LKSSRVRITNAVGAFVNADLWRAVQGGILIGLGASALLLFNGRVAGISGIFFTSLLPKTPDRPWRLAFTVGMIGTGAVLALLRPGSVEPSPVSLPLIAVAGLAVGYGTRLGNGCTSGHGVCGNARLSVRSIVATCLFMAGGGAGLLVVYALTGASR
jgi:uncharacterized protein